MTFWLINFLSLNVDQKTLISMLNYSAENGQHEAGRQFFIIKRIIFILGSNPSSQADQALTPASADATAAFQIPFFSYSCSSERASERRRKKGEEAEGGGGEEGGETIEKKVEENLSCWEYLQLSIFSLSFFLSLFVQYGWDLENKVLEIAALK